jgi:hypothetical protein
VSDERARITAEMNRTAYQKKVVAREPATAVLDGAIAFFRERGYRSDRTGRPNQVFVMGGREGALPRVTAEILVQANVGKARVTMVTISGFGEQLAGHLADYAASLRARGRRSPAPTPDAAAGADPEQP